MPPAAVTVTLTGPGLVLDGLLTTILVAVSLMNVLTTVEPKFTAVACSRLATVIVTVVLPVSGPDEGLIFVTTGA